MTVVYEQQARLRQAFEKVTGYWHSACDQILQASPAYFEAYIGCIEVPWKTGRLPPKVKEFIYITLNASTTHLHEPALRLHIANALRLGATADEIIEVFQTISILGIHSMALSIPIVLEQARASGQEIDITRLSARQIELKERFQATRGYWPAAWDGILALAPDYIEAHDKLGSVPRDHGTLGPKIRELILIAVDAATTHLWESGVRTHVQAALRHGATIEEIVEVLELTSVLGMQSATFGVPILMEEVAKLSKAA